MAVTANLLVYGMDPLQLLVGGENWNSRIYFWGRESMFDLTRTYRLEEFLFGGDGRRKSRRGKPQVFGTFSYRICVSSVVVAGAILPSLSARMTFGVGCVAHGFFVGLIDSYGRFFLMSQSSPCGQKHGHGYDLIFS